MQQRNDRPTIQLVLFDIDGTLVDSFDGYRTAMKKILPAVININPPTSLLAETFALPVDQALNKLGVPANKWAQVMAAYTQLDDGQTPMFSGIVALIRRLKQLGYQVGVVTSRSRNDLAPLGPTLSRMVDVIVTADDTQTHKPAPAPLLAAVQAMAGQPATTLYIGDAQVDELAAQAAGVVFGYAAWNPLANSTTSQTVLTFSTPQTVLNWIMNEL